MHNWNVKGAHTCYAQDEFEELLNDKRLELEFSKQTLTNIIFE